LQRALLHLVAAAAIGGCLSAGAASVPEPAGSAGPASRSAGAAPVSAGTTPVSAASAPVSAGTAPSVAGTGPVSAGAAGAAPAGPSGLGEVDFPTSGAPPAQAAFRRGVLLLHSFEYDDAAAAFREAQQADPGFALAYWGEAMTHDHPIWHEQDREAARAVLARLGATASARLAKASTERERGYLAALDALYEGAGDKAARDRDYAEAMRRLHETWPEDLEAASFYALALLGTAEEGRDIPTYMRAAAVAEEVFARNPRHPGAVHYLIHSYDDPIHAPLGLRPARVYARIAPAASHALHMPSHIFLALGMWDEVAAANEASWAAAEARRRRLGLGLDARGYHALSWLAYAYLQQGRYQAARELLATMAADAQANGSHRTRMHLAVMRAAHLVETRGPGAAAPPEAGAAGLDPEAQAADLFASGYAALRAGDGATARQKLAALQAPRAAAKGQGSVLIMEKELAALLRFAAGKRAEAVALADEAARAEDATSFEFGPPAVVKPAHELAGELLLELGRPAEARRQFEQALARAPGRALALLGLARAAARSGDAGGAGQAREAYAELARNWRHADPGLPELAEVTQGGGGTPADAKNGSGTPADARKDSATPADAKKGSGTADAKKARASTPAGSPTDPTARPPR
jgi:tetratricopeptide (TPR) repeat protein